MKKNKKIVRKIAMILLLVLLINMFTGCQTAVAIGAYTFGGITIGSLVCISVLVVYAVVELIKYAIKGPQYPPKEDLDREILIMNFLPQAKIDALTAFILSLPKDEFNLLVENVYSIPGEKLARLNTDVNSLNETELSFERNRINNLSETEIISIVKNYIAE